MYSPPTQLPQYIRLLSRAQQVYIVVLPYFFQAQSAKRVEDEFKAKQTSNNITALLWDDKTSVFLEDIPMTWDKVQIFLY